MVLPITIGGITIDDATYASPIVMREAVTQQNYSLN